MILSWKCKKRKKRYYLWHNLQILVYEDEVRVEHSHLRKGYMD